MAAKAPPAKDNISRGIFLVTTFLWDVEGAVLNAAKTYGLTEVYERVDVALHAWKSFKMSSDVAMNTCWYIFKEHASVCPTVAVHRPPEHAAGLQLPPLMADGCSGFPGAERTRGIRTVQTAARFLRS